MGQKSDCKNRPRPLSAALLACVLIAGCTWDRSYFQFDSNSRLPFFGLEFRWPPTAQLDRSREKSVKGIDDDESTTESAKQKRRLTVRAQSPR